MAKTGYLVIIYQDINPSSPTYNQTREERTQDEENCPTSAEAHWIEDTKYCELTENGMLTGYEITVYRDVEPLSPTYNQTREEKELNLEECEADSSSPNWQNIGEPFCRQKVYMPGGLMGNDGYMVQQQQDMNEYSETADEIRDVETLDLENCPLPNTEPVWQIISESCHLVTYNGQLVYDGTKDVIRVNTNQYSPSWNNNIPETANIEDEINCPSVIETQYRWVIVSGEYICVGFDKHAMEKKQQSTDGGQTWTDVVPLETKAGEVIEHNSEDCGYEPTYEYRWVVVAGQYECVGYNKYAVEKKQQSIDGGEWTDVSPLETRQGDIIEANSTDCGYVPPTPGGYENQYLTFEALEDGTFTFGDNNSLSYSLDDGQTWTALASGTASPTITTGNKIMWKGTCTPDSSSIGIFSSTGTFDAYGNIMSIVYEDNFRNSTVINNAHFGFLFGGTKVVNAENLVLPSTTLASNCYYFMFYDCKSLITAPALPATTLANNCYYNMFAGCTSLTTAPALPATELAEKCYWGMFQSCTSLVNAPVLPATTLESECYNIMFKGCTSLTTAPALPATTLATYCYERMFNGCTSLNYIKAMFTTTPSTTYTKNWVSGVASTGTFVKNSEATWNVSGVNGIPSGWTVETINQ